MMAAYYQLGDGGRTHMKKARDWYRRAAEAGNTEAMAGIGALYRATVTAYCSARQLRFTGSNAVRI